MGSVKMVNCHYQQNNCISESYKKQKRIYDKIRKKITLNG